MATRESDPLISFHFAIDIQGKIAGYFTECSGLGSEHEIIEHKVVDAKGREVIQKIPGRMKWQDITLKRGITKEMDVWVWRKEVEDGNVEGARRNGSIVMFDQSLKEVARWNFERGWPTKVTGPSLQSDSNAFGVEEMTITHEGLIRVK
ncbi:MAG: phage tail protein [Chloroflexi bacterium]|nr:phage tail protein [Chloroflexota bacterium]